MKDLALRLRELSSAEDFLDFFGVPFDRHVVDVSRLHILKRFFQYIRQAPRPADETEADMYRDYRVQLTRAYDDFVRSTPAQEKVFKVFQDAEGQGHVSLQSLRESLPSATRRAA